MKKMQITEAATASKICTVNLAYICSHTIAPLAPDKPPPVDSCHIHTKAVPITETTSVRLEYPTLVEAISVRSTFLFALRCLAAFSSGRMNATHDAQRMTTLMATRTS
jgi:hypothetical protein